MRLAGGERDRERLAGRQQMPLADDVVDRARAQPLGERYRIATFAAENRSSKAMRLAFAWSDYAR